MKRLTALLLLSLSAQICAGATPADIVGNWQYDGFFFEDHRYPIPDPNLHVLFTFNSDLTGRLYWYHADQPGFCERKSTYVINDNILKQTVTWLNPENDSSCGKDPDMQPGRTTENEIDLGTVELAIHMELNGKPLLYLLKRL